jgi:hypothetical protein
VGGWGREEGREAGGREGRGTHRNDQLLRSLGIIKKQTAHALVLLSLGIQLLLPVHSSSCGTFIPSGLGSLEKMNILEYFFKKFQKRWKNIQIIWKMLKFFWKNTSFFWKILKKI